MKRIVHRRYEIDNADLLQAVMLLLKQRDHPMPGDKDPKTFTVTGALTVLAWQEELNGD